MERTNFSTDRDITRKILELYIGALIGPLSRILDANTIT